MKKTINAVILALACTLCVSGAYALDVNANAQHYVKVSLSGVAPNQSVMFEECFKQNAKPCVRTLGPKKWYTMKELNSQRATETWQAYGATAFDVAATIVTGGAGAVAGAAAGGTLTAIGAGPGLVTGILSGFAGFFGGAVGGAIVGTGGAVTAIAYINAINPFEQFAQANTLSSDVVNGRPVETGNLDKFIQRLELVLGKL